MTAVKHLITPLYKVLSQPICIIQEKQERLFTMCVEDVQNSLELIFVV